MRPAFERLVREELLGDVVVELGELEREEEELCLGAPASGQRARAAPRGASAMSVANHRWAVDRAREDGLDPLALLDRLREPGRVQLGHLVVVVASARRRLGLQVVRFESWVVTALVEVGGPTRRSPPPSAPWSSWRDAT